MMKYVFIGAAAFGRWDGVELFARVTAALAKSKKERPLPDVLSRVESSHEPASIRLPGPHRRQREVEISHRY